MTAPDCHPALSKVMRSLPELVADERPTLGDIIRALGDRAVGLVLVAFAVPAIVPTPGIPAGMVFGSALALIGLQMLLATKRLRLPPGIARIRIRRTQLKAIIRRAVPFLERIERRMKARALPLCGPIASRWLGLIIFILAIFIALPIPFGNTLPGIAILILALGLAHQDGVAVAVGLSFGVAASLFSVALIRRSWWLVEKYLLN